ncbi:tRNA (cytidine(34)-2'-O)-methyltransferase [Chitinilyticum litopenaei]|uniref:tRNA (cytidine(34)-2'-O)-methyltransferase n=1 Tax=Chitinilyticum litopenaei TaxID=1121276 RepID=UPI000406C231|nr:tRNA (cytidine(34)-2'-O)-methyltransferase [Chitinilyticum litopenaei]
MFDVVLYQPEIPPNTGNIIRLSANAGVRLHLVKPLGFPLDDAKMRRAGLDYHEYADLRVHDHWDACRAALAGRRIFAATTKGAVRYDSVSYREDDVLLFGPETRGLPDELLADFSAEQRIRLPMRPDNRSLNLSNAVAIIVYEAWRQQGFTGGL